MITELQGSVYRRESMFERLTANVSLKTESKKEKTDRTLLSKKLHDLENIIRKLDTSADRIMENIRSVNTNFKKIAELLLNQPTSQI